MNEPQPEPDKDAPLSHSLPRRERLPDTRVSINHHFEIRAHNETVDGYITVGLYPDGRPGEVFLKIGREGSTLGGLMDTIGILTSMALQHGVPVSSLSKKLTHMSFEPSGWTSNRDLRKAKSITDYVFRWLEMTFPESGE